MEEAVRWNIKVSKETDIALRTLLGSQGMKKGDQSEDDPRDEEERLLLRHRDLPTLLVWPAGRTQFESLV